MPVYWGHQLTLARQAAANTFPLGDDEEMFYFANKVRA